MEKDKDKVKTTIDRNGTTVRTETEHQTEEGKNETMRKCTIFHLLDRAPNLARFRRSKQNKTRVDTRGHIRAEFLHRNASIRECA